MFVKILSSESQVLTSCCKINKKNQLILEVGNYFKFEKFAREGRLGVVQMELIKGYGGSCVMMGKVKLDYFVNVMSILDRVLQYEGQEVPGVFVEVMSLMRQVVTSSDQDFKAICLLAIKNILKNCGYGFQLEECVVTQSKNIDDLIFISPKSWSAVSSKAAIGYENKLLKLPKFFITNTLDASVECIECGSKIVDKFVQKVLMA